MAHKCGSVLQEDLKCLQIREVSFTTTDTFFQVKRIGTCFQHIHIIVGFKEGRMALFEMPDEQVIGFAHIGKHADRHLIVSYNEIVRVDRIVWRWKCGDGEAADLYGDMGLERGHEVFPHPYLSLLKSGRCHVNREVVFFRQPGYAIDMVGMLMGNKNGLDPFDGKLQTSHTTFSFPARDSSIDKNRFLVIAYIIAIAVAAGIE